MDIEQREQETALRLLWNAGGWDDRERIDDLTYQIIRADGEVIMSGTPGHPGGRPLAISPVNIL